MPQTVTREGRFFRQPISQCDDRLKVYLGAVSASYCPYIEPSDLRSLLLFSEYSINASDEESLCRNLFYVGLIHTEILRAVRLRIGEKKGSLLASENMIFDGEFINQIEGEDVFRWPHWLLKVLYTDRGLLFGKFWKGERVKSRDGREVPAPPVHLLSIRSAVKPVDRRFFEITPELLEIHASSFDDGAIFDFPMSADTREVLGLISSSARSGIEQSLVIELCVRCEQTFLFLDCLKEVISRETVLYSGRSFAQNRFGHLLGKSDAK